VRRKKVSRRDFLCGVAGVAAFTIVPRHVLGGAGHKPPSEKLNVACIGIGGMGGSDSGQMKTETVVALCDVDSKRGAGTFKRYPEAKQYKDFRKMLEKEKSIEAVTVSTPDHTHAVAAMMAIKMGKHVYCQKPLAHDLYEVRRMTEAARENKVATQMGTQLHAEGYLRQLVEMVKSGVIGKIHRVDIFSNKNWGGGTRPTDTPPAPETLDWDLWLGPAPWYSSDGYSAGARDAGLGFVAWACAVSSLPSDLRAGELAAMVGLRDRDVRRYGLSYNRSCVVGSGFEVSDEHRGRAGRFQRRDLSDEDDCEVGVPRKG